MTIVRDHTHSKNFVIIHKDLLNDQKISFKAKGIWAYLMGLPDNWKISAREVARHSKEGYDSVLSGLKELVDNGYASYVKPKNEKGDFEKGGWIVYETKKISTERDFPCLDFANTDFADQPNPELLSIEVTSIEKEQQQQKESSRQESVPQNVVVVPSLKKIDVNEKFRQEMMTLKKSSGEMYSEQEIDCAVEITLNAKPRCKEAYLRKALIEGYHKAETKESIANQNKAYACHILPSQAKQDVGYTEGLVRLDMLSEGLEIVCGRNVVVLRYESSDFKNELNAALKKYFPNLK